MSPDRQKKFKNLKYYHKKKNKKKTTNPPGQKSVGTFVLLKSFCPRIWYYLTSSHRLTTTIILRDFNGLSNAKFPSERHSFFSRRFLSWSASKRLVYNVISMMVSKRLVCTVNFLMVSRGKYTL